MSNLAMIRLRQFARGVEGILEDKENLQRRLHKSTVSFPAFAGCCSSIVKNRSFYWVYYRQARWQVRFAPSANGWELTLPAEDILMDQLAGVKT